MKRLGGVSAELAAVDGRKRLNMDKVMTVVCFVLLLIIVVIPIVMIIFNAFFNEGKLETQMFVEQVTDGKNLEAMWNTLKIALFATIFGTIMGVFYAWLLGRSDIPAKGLMRALFNIPYMFPPFLGAMAWDMMFNGRSGYINKMLRDLFSPVKTSAVCSFLRFHKKTHESTFRVPVIHHVMTLMRAPPLPRLHP